MSGSTIGGLAGAAIGFFIPGIGPAFGAAIGSFLGGVIAPPTIEGPKIGDAQRTQIQPGLPRPKALGMPAPFGAAIIGGETLARKVTVKTKQGKGGPTIKEQKFYLTSAIGCGEPGEIIWIEYDGVVVLDRRPAEMLPEGWEGYSEEVKIAQAKFLENARLYNGSEDQLPDPDLEAIHGVGNTPAFRGTAYFVHIDVDRTLTKGTAGQYRVMIASCATITDGGNYLLSLGPEFYYPMQGGDYSDATGNHATLVPFNDYEDGDGIKFKMIPPGSGHNTGTLEADSGALATGLSTYTVLVRVQVDEATDVSGTSGEKAVFRHLTNSTFGFVEWAVCLRSGNGAVDPTNMTPQVIINNMAGAGFTVNGPSPLPVGGTYVLGFRQNGTLFELLSGGSVIASRNDVTGSFSGSAVLQAGANTFAGTVGHAIGFNRALSNAEMSRASLVIHAADDLIPVPDAPGFYYDPETGETLNANEDSSAELCDVSLQEIVEEIAERCGVPASKLDASALAGIFVPGYLLSQQVSGKAVLEPLMLAYQFDLPEYDGQIIARLRGGPINFTISEGQLLATGTDDETIRPQGMEYPAKVTVLTQEPEANYAAIPQTSPRMTPDVRATGEVTINLAIPLGADEAAQVAHKVHMVLFAQAEGECALSLPPDFFTLIASDPIEYADRRWLVTKTDMFEGCLSIEAKYETPLAYSSTTTGHTPEPPTPPTGSVKGPTRFVAANLPSLRPQDNVPGVYIFAMGPYRSWPGCDVYLSTDGGATYSLVETITQASTMGQLVEDEPSGGDPLTVRLWDASGELENATTAQVAQGQNSAAVIDGSDVAEIIGFENATQQTSGDWDIHTLTRGGLGTDEATHLTGERFVMLELATFLPVPAEFAGVTLIFRAVTIGTPVDSNPTTTLVFEPPNFVLDGGGA